MSSDVIIGHDGKPRCGWVGGGDTASVRYHDEVWGTRTYDESAMFEALTLGVFEVGLSWSIVFGKRDAFLRAFWRFDVAKVAAMTDAGRRPAGAGRLDHPKPGQDPGHRRQCPRDDDRLTNSRGSREVLRDHPQAGTAVARRPTQVDSAGGGVREAVEVAGIPLRRAYKCVRVHAERRRGQRPRPWVLPRERLPDHGRESLKAGHRLGCTRRPRVVPSAFSGSNRTLPIDGTLLILDSQLFRRKRGDGVDLVLGQRDVSGGEVFLEVLDVGSTSVTPRQRGAMPLRPGNEATTSPEAGSRSDNAKRRDLGGAASGRVTRPAELGIDHVSVFGGLQRGRIPTRDIGCVRQRAVP